MRKPAVGERKTYPNPPVCNQRETTRQTETKDSDSKLPQSSTKGLPYMQLGTQDEKIQQFAGQKNNALLFWTYGLIALDKHPRR